MGSVRSGLKNNASDNNNTNSKTPRTSTLSHTLKELNMITNLNNEEQENISPVVSDYDSEESEEEEADDNTASSSSSEDDDSDHGEAVEESDSSEDEVAPRNTIGDVPLKWYEDEEHLGYDITGKKLKKQARKDMLDKLLANADDSNNWRKIYDEYNDEEVELTSKEIRVIRRLVKGKSPNGDIDPYAPYVDWFVWEDAKHPLSNTPEPKNSFLPSKWEAKKVLKLVRAIRKGNIQIEKPTEESHSQLYLLWREGDESSTLEEARRGLKYIPAPKPKLAGHEESYNPSVEYIPTEEEKARIAQLPPEERPNFIPTKFEYLRSVPAYEKALKESFDRCLDLYLCPRTLKRPRRIDPESLKPKLPSRRDLKPYPSTCYLEYKGHTGAVLSISVEVSGQWLASGSSDGTVRLWEVETGRCVRVWDIGEAVHYVAWNPVLERRILAVCSGHDVLVLNTGLGNEEEQEKIKELLQAPRAVDEELGTQKIVDWLQYDEGIRLKHIKAVSSVEWHFKGDYFSTVMPTGDSRAILIHQLSKKNTQNIARKLHGLPGSSVFHPTRHIFYITTKNYIRVHDLVKNKLIKKLQPGFREISSIAIHPAGDNVIVGSHDGKLCWFDMDLSGPYLKLKCHAKDITNVAFHRSYPLFASCSEDSTAYVFHGMVFSDLNEDPLIVPLEILRGHKSTKGRGVMDCVFHPRQPWLFTAGADSVIKLYCHQ